MAEQTQAVRTDVDILADIQRWMNSYPPFVNDRHHVQVDMKNGTAYVHGNTKSPVTRKYVQEHMREVEGVQSVDASGLHDDDTIRLALGKLMPAGVIANVEWGMVVLSGKLPADSEVEALMAQVGTIAGVRRVVTVG
ncbi:MAG: BON domain-containing protein [Chloroflexota bacterium]|nr:BON domain-containing protein [Chloroflexota bacterium]